MTARLVGRDELLSEVRPSSFVEGRAPGLAPVIVAYERRGNGEPVVLLHGAGHHRGAWEGVVPLVHEERETIALDLPGFGQSPDLDPAVPRDLETTVTWMGAVFTALELERPHVVGHSLGGLIALRLAQAGLARSVTAVAPAGFWTQAERRYAYAVLNLARHAGRILTASPEAVARAARATRLVGLPAALNSLIGLRLPEGLAAELRVLPESAAFEAILRAGRALDLFTGDIPDVPVTIAWGGRDRILPPWQSVRAQSMIPGARLELLPGCGHVPMADAPELVARVLLEATRSTNPPPGFRAAT
ncbi:alpha/beta fold hydrolase [Streptomyces sp. NPDC055103]